MQTLECRFLDFLGAENLRFSAGFVPLFVAIFLFLKEKQKGFSLLSGLIDKDFVFLETKKRKKKLQFWFCDYLKVV